MNQMTWVRGVNAAWGRLAPQMLASRLRVRFMTPRSLPPRDWELPLLASAERITLRFGLSALRWGSGPAVLLMHGWEGRPTQFAMLIRGWSMPAMRWWRWMRRHMGARRGVKPTWCCSRVHCWKLPASCRPCMR